MKKIIIIISILLLIIILYYIYSINIKFICLDDEIIFFWNIWEKNIYIYFIVFGSIFGI